MLLPVGTVVEFVIPNSQYQWYTGWFRKMAKSKEIGEIVSCKGSRYEVKPLSKDTSCPFKDFSTDANTVKVLNIFKKF